MRDVVVGLQYVDQRAIDLQHGVQQIERTLISDEKRLRKDRNYVYSFDALAKTTEAFVDALALKKYALYIFDYGAPVGLRLAVAHPDRVTGLISQNGNAYEEGLGDAWAPIRKYWATPSAENREAVKQAALGYEGTKFQYVEGVPDPAKIEPESYMLDAALLDSRDRLAALWRVSVQYWLKNAEIQSRATAPMVAATT